MIILSLAWLVTLTILTAAQNQNARSYDTNEWIPIEPANTKEVQKTARVLNLDSPNQKFFPDDEYLRKRPQGAQQYLRETNFPKGRPHHQHHPHVLHQQPQLQPQQQHRQPPRIKIPTNHPYKFDSVAAGLPPPPPPQFLQQQQQPQFVQPSAQQQQQLYLPYQQGVVPNQNLVAPAQNSPNLYEALNPGVLNQELLGAIQKPQALIGNPPPKPQNGNDKESVQLLYVPLENIKQQQLIQQVPVEPVLREEKPVFQPQQQRQQLGNVGNIGNIEQDFINQALAAHKLQQQFQSGQPVLLQTTTPKVTTKKRKPHQPPLAVYMEKEGPADVNDVLNVLKNVKTISVQDSISPNSPQVFVGPSNLESASGYTKFPLPYLSSVDGNRIERKVDELPFFVAPLSYKAPKGYSKIALPSPHVGSVVVKEQIPQASQQIQTNSNLIGAPTFKPQLLQEQSFILPSAPGGGSNFLNNFQLEEIQNSGSLKNFRPSYEEKQAQNFDFRQTYQEPGSFLQEYQPKPQSVPVQQAGRQQIGQFQVPVLEGFLPSRGQEPTDLFNYNPEPVQVQPVRPLEQPVRTPAISTTTTTTSKPVANTEPLPRPYNRVKVPDQNEFQKFRPETQFKLLEPEEQTEFQPLGQPELEPNGQYAILQQPEVRPEPDRFSPELQPQNRFKPPQNRYKPEPEPELQPNRFQQQFDLQQQNRFNAELSQFEPEKPRLQFDPVQKPSLNQAITQLELDQINQFIRGTNYDDVPTTTGAPVPVTNVNYDTYETTTRAHRGRPRQRQRPTTTLATTTTTAQLPTTTQPPSLSVSDKYTVLEEFPVQQPQGDALPKYKTEVETIPANVYKLTSDRLEPVYIQPQQHVLNQAMLDEQILGGQFPTNHFQEQQQQPQQINEQIPTLSAENNFPSRHHQTHQIINEQIPALSTIRQQQQEHQFNEQLSTLPTDDGHLAPLVFNRGSNNDELPNLVNNLQDHGVKPLLVPNLLVPTTEKLIPTEYISHEPLTTTTEATTTTTAATTTTRRNRGRQRANTSRYSTTSTPRRTVSRRRPVNTRPTTTTTERQIYRATIATDNVENYDSTRRSINSASRQRFRTRGRPLQTTQAPVQETSVGSEGTYKLQNNFKHPQVESVQEPQSYMQFEHTINDQEVITVKADPHHQKEYHLTHQLIEEQTNRPVVDIQISHPVTEPIGAGLTTNIQSGGVLYNTAEGEDGTTKRTKNRIRSRVRTTVAPPTTTSRGSSVAGGTSEEEYYGFIRTPTYNRPAPLIHTTTEQVLNRAGYSTGRTLIQIDDEPLTTTTSSVRFIGEIRPKYPATTVEPLETETPRIRTQRPRIRVSSTRKPGLVPKQVTNEVTRRTDNLGGIRSRSRGKSTFKLPENLRKKQEDDDEIEGGNYPSTYLKATVTPRNTFQITVDPSDQEQDQELHPSLYQPKWVEASSFNALPLQDKRPQLQEDGIIENEEEEVPEDGITDITTTNLPTTLMDIDSGADTSSITTTESVTTTKPARRRGVWKLVRQRPVFDQFEVAESQNYQSVLNDFGQILKVSSRKTTTLPPPVSTTINNTVNTTTTESTLLNALYNMFGLHSDGKDKTTSSTTTTTTSSSDSSSVADITTVPSQDIVSTVTTTQPSPTFPEEFTEEIVTTMLPKVVDNRDKEQEIPVPVTTTTSTAAEQPITATETTLKKYEVQPWEMHMVRTSTSTEVSHETEICYKGRCIKTIEDKPRL